MGAFIRRLVAVERKLARAIRTIADLKRRILVLEQQLSEQRSVL